MKKLVKKVKLEVKPSVSEIENTVIVEEKAAEVKKVDRLDLGFPNEDMNRVVAKLNEVIDKLND